jgi:thioredoxin reductase
MTRVGADVGIIGAGFAGLAAALTLGRERLEVLVFDGGPTHNAWAAHVHNYLGVKDCSSQ